MYHILSRYLEVEVSGYLEMSGSLDPEIVTYIKSWHSTTRTHNTALVCTGSRGHKRAY